jgi:hypothetical protein
MPIAIFWISQQCRSDPSANQGPDCEAFRKTLN